MADVPLPGASSKATRRSSLLQAGSSADPPLAVKANGVGPDRPSVGSVTIVSPMAAATLVPLALQAGSRRVFLGSR